MCVHVIELKPRVTGAHGHILVERLKHALCGDMSDDILDTCGLLCPLPVLKTRKRLKDVASGARLTVQTDDPAALIDMPHFCAEAGHSVIESVTNGDITTWVLEKG